MKSNPRLNAILQALLVTFIWSTSWIIIKLFIHEIPPLTFAGLRFSLAVLFLLPGFLRQREVLPSLKASDQRWLLLLGLIYYGIMQGTQILTIKHLDAIAFTLILNFTSIVVAIAGIFLLKETIRQRQWFGLALLILGTFLFFTQSAAAQRPWIGLVLAIVSMLLNASSSLLGRFINREQRIPAIAVTAISMAVGGFLLLITGLIVEGFPHLSLQAWLALLWLALVNTAFAFWTWNRSLQVLTAVESSVINNTMLIQISLLAWIFLDERVSLLQGLALLIAAAGSVLVNLKTKSA